MKQCGNMPACCTLNKLCACWQAGAGCWCPQPHLAGAGAAQWVAQRDGSAVGVDLVNVDAQSIHAVGGLRTWQQGE